MNPDVAEIMRLYWAGVDVERRACIGKAQGFDCRDAAAALEAKVTELAADREKVLATYKYQCSKISSLQAALAEAQKKLNEQTSDSQTRA